MSEKTSGKSLSLCPVAGETQPLSVILFLIVLGVLGCLTLTYHVLYSTVLHVSPVNAPGAHAAMLFQSPVERNASIKPVRLLLLGEQANDTASQPVFLVFSKRSCVLQNEQV